ncbi:hypothetical protein BCR34DRAFT_582010 [Clohesyomyces aquaticus]|uniref:Uncharacterized protein n=1 Tax=Clohesyomyces aquaticus TaxID=1231657 RepID=A0A1Y2ABB5_9PLEO|nr:hypothetical protein BCR34DRAFT_582010 [Clohesyomyces aquaticus]
MNFNGCETQPRNPATQQTRPTNMDTRLPYSNGADTLAQVSKGYNPDVKKDSDASQVMSQELTHFDDCPPHVAMAPNPSHVQPLPEPEPSTLSASPVFSDASTDARDSSARMGDDTANTVRSKARWEYFVETVSQAMPLEERPPVKLYLEPIEDDVEVVDAAKILLRMHVEDAMLSWEKWGLARGGDLGEWARLRGENEEVDLEASIEPLCGWLASTIGGQKLLQELGQSSHF